MKKSWQLLIIFNLIYIIAFLIYDFINKNHEFLAYILIVISFFIITILTIHKTKFTNSILWLLSSAGFLHLFSGGIFINGKSLYYLPVISIVENSNFFILRWDQLMHFYGIFVMTIVAYHLLKIYLKKNEIPFFIYIAAFFMGVGWGSCIEIYEFLVAISIEENGVGGYYNNALDLFFNTLGALFASMILYLKDNKKNL